MQSIFIYLLHIKCFSFYALYIIRINILFIKKCGYLITLSVYVALLMGNIHGAFFSFLLQWNTCGKWHRTSGKPRLSRKWAGNCNAVFSVPPHRHQNHHHELTHVTYPCNSADSLERILPPIQVRHFYKTRDFIESEDIQESVDLSRNFISGKRIK